MRSAILLHAFVIILVQQAELIDINTPAVTFHGTLADLLSSSGDVIQGLVRTLPYLMPSAENLAELPKNVVEGFPLAIASSVISAACTLVLARDEINPKYVPTIDDIQFQFRTPCDIQYYSAAALEDVVNNPAFNKSKPAVVMVSGWITTENHTTIDTIAQAYLCRGDVNFFALDNGGFIDTLYTWSSLNTKKIGEFVAQGLVKLTKTVPVENIHLIGHSLGAQIVGSAGRAFQNQTGKLLKHITGLDPAKPCFVEGTELPGIQRGVAEFVDIVHSNPGILGKPEPLGDLDYYPNGFLPLPPGCLEFYCAHSRAWMYYAESVYPDNERNFLAKRCNSLEGLRLGECSGEEIPMMYAVPHDVTGNYFSEVNAYKPYGKNGSEERIKEQEKCGLCSTN